MTISDLTAFAHARHCSGEGCPHTGPVAAVVPPIRENRTARRSSTRGRRERRALDGLGASGRHRAAGSS